MKVYHVEQVCNIEVMKCKVVFYHLVAIIFWKSHGKSIQDVDCKCFQDIQIDNLLLNMDFLIFPSLYGDITAKFGCWISG
jgi:hypothetical protein